MVNLSRRAQGNVSAEGRAEFDIVAPGLAVTMTGPTAAISNGKPRTWSR